MPRRISRLSATPLLVLVAALALSLVDGVPASAVETARDADVAATSPSVGGSLRATPSPRAAARVPGKARWLRDTRAAMVGSRAYVGRRAERGAPTGRRLAVNLDIDNSSLATYYDEGTAIPVVLRFARYAHRHGVRLLWNTGRRANALRAVTRDLRREGFAVTEVCGRRAGEALVHGKRRCRRHFVRSGYTLVANVGNRATDFRGTPRFGRAFRLPNYGNELG